MKIVMLGRLEQKTRFEALARILELERIKTSSVFFDSTAEDILIRELKAADFYLVSLSDGIGGKVPDSEAARFEALATGYAIACTGKTMFYCCGDCRVPVSADYYASSETLGGVISAVRHKKAEYEKQKRFMEARDMIHEAGFSFSSKGFIEAVCGGMADIAEAFLGVDFSPDTEDGNGVPVLSMASRLSDIDTCRILLSYGAQVNGFARDRRTTALMDAVANGDELLSRMLIDAGADLDYKNRNGQTALVLAIGIKNIALARLLIEKGADTEAADSIGMKALSYAKLFSMTEIIDMIEQRIGVNAD